MRRRALKVICLLAAMGVATLAGPAPQINGYGLMFWFMWNRLPGS